MSVEINESQEILKRVAVSFNRARVVAVDFRQEKVEGTRQKYSTEHDMKETDRISTELSGKTVQEALDEIEASEGQAPDLSSLSVQDFVNSLIHEAAKDQG